MHCGTLFVAGKDAIPEDALPDVDVSDDDDEEDARMGGAQKAVSHEEKRRVVVSTLVGCYYSAGCMPPRLWHALLSCAYTTLHMPCLGPPLQFRFRVLYFVCYHSCRPFNSTAYPPGFFPT